MKNNYKIRLITTADAEAARNIYAPYVLHTAVSFEYLVPTVEEFTYKIEKITAQYPWLVCEVDGEIAGYAYGSTHRDRTGYQWSPEVTVYLDERFHRKGIARALYSALLEILKIQGYFNTFAGVLVTNEKSVEFHRAMGFEDIGLFKNIGFKLGEWHTNLWMQYAIQEPVSNPPVPIAIGEIIKTEEFKKIMERANEQLSRHFERTK
jgi:phosphinothricin acetyltransferase